MTPKKKAAPPPDPPPNQSSNDPDPEKAAWRTTFFLENHLDHFAFPAQVGSPEQIRFMVYLDEYQRYYPCSERTFNEIMSRKRSAYIQKMYISVLEQIYELIDAQIEDEREKKYLQELVRLKYEHETRDQLVLPTRLEKRLIHIFLNRTQIVDPWAEEKRTRNLRTEIVLRSDAFNEALNHWDISEFEKPPANLAEIKRATRQLEFRRLLSLTGEKGLWEKEAAESKSVKDFLGIFKRPINGNGLESLIRLLGIDELDATPAKTGRRILWLANEAGEVIVDLAIIRYLTQLGHKIVIAFLEGPRFTQAHVYDSEHDEVLAKHLEGAYLIQDKQLRKNDLVKILRQDNDILVLSDGTHEALNLLLVSTTFARIFKEVDAVVTRGYRQRKRFFETRFEFTQDIYNIMTDENGCVSVDFRPHHPSLKKFSHADLGKKAKTIIDQMLAAKKAGMTVVFYSGIIGSIPGKIQIAKKIMTVFIHFLKKQLDKTFIINPSEYYEPGMDADDLMYMWEIVQTSGYIDIWRFQTYDDIAKAFRLMDKKVPPEWVGKDATFSTGCTKEMRIAERVQQQYPEMQIIGPAREKFMRRDEYGVGKMFDQRLKPVGSH
ncbi:MAG: ARMT1-like domain-containing protein [Pseudomonadota bacterium]